MIPGAARGLLLAAALAALGCMNTTELAEWRPDSGGPDAGGDDTIVMDCSGCPAEGADVANLRCAIDLCDPAVVLNGDGEYVAVTEYRLGVEQSCTVDDTRAAIARFGEAGNDLGSKLNVSYAVMATGDWDAPAHSTSCSPLPEEDVGSDGLSYDANETGDAEYPIYDAVEWKLALRAPEDARSFSFDYVFFSTEYDEWIVGDHNDKFYATIEAASTAGGAATVINFTACRDDDVYYDFECTSENAIEQSCTAGVKYCYIAINSALSECCYYNGCPGGTAETSIAGTGYDCGTEDDDGTGHGSSTGWLHTVWPIDGGEEFTLTFHIHDTADSGWDSAVILDAFEFHRSFHNGGTIIIE